MRTYTLIFALLTVGLFACKDETPTKKTETEEPITYDGNWSGSYSGDDNGTLDIAIDVSNAITGFGKSNVTTETFTITGSINTEGELVNVKTDVGTDLIGSLTATSGSGTWINNTSNTAGHWTISKNP
ncbi:MAG: hypothetical protein ACI9UJ_002063 [bacterium]|jgi:hypothetical protein